MSGELLGQELARGSEPAEAAWRVVRGHRELGQAEACESSAKMRPCAVSQFSDLLVPFFVPFSLRTHAAGAPWCRGLWVLRPILAHP